MTAQLGQLHQAGCQEVFKEKISGSRIDRPELMRILANVNGDSGDREHPTCLHIGLGGFLPQVFTISQDWLVFSVKIPLLI